jgi:hypothetical protein
MKTVVPQKKETEVLGREIFTFVSVTTWGYLPAINEKEKKEIHACFPLNFMPLLLETFHVIFVSPPLLYRTG